MKLTDAQHLAVTSIDKNVMVAAGAGSGKTRVLVERMIEILRQHPNLKVSHLMAVTFTRKAAGEMKARLKARMQELISAGDNQKRWQKALGEIDSAHIGTIHSLCESILRKFPVESHVDPQFEILDELEQAEIIDRTLKRTLLAIISEQSKEHLLLLNYSLEEIQRWLTLILKSPSQFNAASAQLANLNKAQFEERVTQRYQEIQARILQDLVLHAEWQRAFTTLQQNVVDQSNKLFPLRQNMLILVEEINSAFKNAGSNNLLHAWVNLSTMQDIKPGNSGGNSEEALALRGAIRELKALSLDKIEPFLPEKARSDYEEWELLVALVSMAQQAQKIYTKEKEALHKLDYDDLIRLTEEVLKEHKRVREHYQRNLKEILIDEFQDTNRIQANLLTTLAGPETRLFLIGDDKQSIYKFQGTDVSIFNQWLELFSNDTDTSALQGERLIVTLEHSFRSHPSLINFVNTIFSHLLSNKNTRVRYRASHRPLSPPEDVKSQDDNARLEVISFAIDANSNWSLSEALKEKEGRLVADWILEKIKSKAPIVDKKGTRPITYGDFAILVQRNNDFAYLEEALSAQEIPFATIGGKSFLSRQEIFDIENLLDFLANTNNDHALLGALRSPIFALTDDLLHNLITQNKCSLWSALKQAVQSKKEGYQLVSRALFLLNRFLEESANKTLGSLVRSIITTTNYDLILMTTTDGHQRSRNLWKLAQLAADKENLSCGEFSTYLKEMRELQIKDANAPLETQDSVQLMTIHTAKGLEFPAVILPALHNRFKSYTNKIIYHPEYGLALNTARSSDEPRPLWYQLGQAIDQDMEEAEKKRLLYVAMTRAKDYLGIFLPDSGRKDKSFSLWLRALLALLVDDLENKSAGKHFCQLPGGQTGFILHNIDSTEDTINKPASSESEGVSLSKNFEVINFDLLESIVSAPIEPPPIFTGLKRITPLTSQIELDPVITGNFFHTLMEHTPADFKPISQEAIQMLASSVHQLAINQDFLNALIQEGTLLMNKFYKSELYETMKKAKIVLFEMPYYKFDENKAANNRPDLLIQKEDGNWLIVDFKTDHFILENIEQQARLHSKQLKRYQEDIAKIANIQAEIAIYFAQHGLLHTASQSQPV